MQADSDIDALSAFFRGWGMELIQLTARCTPTFVSRVSSGSHRIIRLHSGSSIVMRGSVRSASSCVFLCASEQPAIRLVGQPLHANALALVGGTARLDILVPSGAVLHALVIDSSCISRSTVRVYDADADPQHAHSRLTRYILTPHLRDESVIDIVKSVAAVKAASHVDDEVDVPRIAAVASACRLIDRCYPNAVSLNELSRHCGVAERTLEYGFRQVYGTTPLTFMRNQRLSRSHLALLRDRSIASISETARACGFTHMGQYSRDYRRLFGETPSMTLVRGQSRHVSQQEKATPSAVSRIQARS